MSDEKKRMIKCDKAMDYLNSQFPDAVYMCIVFPDETVEAWDSKQIPLIVEKLSDNLEVFLDKALKQQMARNN